MVKAVRVSCVLLFMVVFLINPVMIDGELNKIFCNKSVVDKSAIECALENLESEYAVEYAYYFLDYKSIIRAIVSVESQYKSGLITSERGGEDYSVGYMQIRVDTAQHVMKLWRACKSVILIMLLDTQYNIFVGSEYFLSKLKKYQSVELAIAAYNSGRPKYNKKGELVNAEYVKKVLSAYKVI